jgi:peroxiredoxin
MGVHKGLMAASLALAAGIVAITAVVLASDSSDQPLASGDTAVVLGGSGSDLDPTIGTNAAVAGTPLPDVEVQTLQGDVVQISDLVGSPLVVNVWYAGCVPCKKELPAIAAVHADLGETIRFVGVDSLGPSQSEEDFARGKGVQYELLYDTDGAFVSAAGISTQPVTLLVDGGGSIVAQAGEVTEESLRRLIEDHLM